MNADIMVGAILIDTTTNQQYRIIHIGTESMVLCSMNTTSLVLTEHLNTVVLNMVHQNLFLVEQDSAPLFVADTLSDNIRTKYENKRSMMNAITKIYGPTYLSLMGKSPKPELQQIMQDHDIAKAVGWRTIIKYLQSGMQNVSLVDGKAFGVNTGKEYSYSKRPGKPVQKIGNSQLVLTEEVKKHFAEALVQYKNGRQNTIQSAFDYMNNLHYSKTIMTDGKLTSALLPPEMRPSFDQFYNYFRTHLSEQEKDLIKTSAREQRNNKRLITSDALCGVKGPGDVVEIDACEADVSLVSVLDPNQTVGRPIVYFMVDVYSRIILAASITFDNNSILGLTNLFLNLADNKQEFCQRFGLGFDNPMLWPSNIIPKRVRVDHGAEFKGKEFARICDELNIERIMAPVATGSMKGIVEQSFHQMHQKQNVHLENHGLIEKRYDSQHHEDSSLNIAQYTRMIINFVLSHNQTSLSTYPLTKEMIEKGIQPIPSLLWQHGIDKYGMPRPIINTEQYLFNLMIPVKAKVSRRGIEYKDLWYLPESDPKLSHEMFNAGKKKIPFEVRIDMRDISNVYYLRNNKMIVAPLNPRLNGNADYRGLTMKQYEEYRKEKKNLIAVGQSHNQELNAFTYAINETVVQEAKKKTSSNKKNLRASREQEKQIVSSANKISKRLPEALPEPTVVEALPEPKKTTKPNSEQKEYANFDEALDDLWDE